MNAIIVGGRAIEFRPDGYVRQVGAETWHSTGWVPNAEHAEHQGIAGMFAVLGHLWPDGTVHHWCVLASRASDPAMRGALLTERDLLAEAADDLVLSRDGRSIDREQLESVPLVAVAWAGYELRRRAMDAASGLSWGDTEIGFDVTASQAAIIGKLLAVFPHVVRAANE